MNQFLKTLFALFFVCSLGYCVSYKPASYSYRVNTYTIDSVERLYFFGDLISYGDYLLEFQKKMNIERNLTPNSDSTLVTYDTIGVFLLSAANKLFYKFDTFSVSTKLLAVGNIKNKPTGLRLSSSQTSPVSAGSFTEPRSGRIHGVDYFITDVNENKTGNHDSLKQELLLFKRKDFNSLFKVNGIKFPDPSYCIVGFRITDTKRNQIFLQTAEFLRPLTLEQEKICSAMVQASKQAKIDTIQEY